MKAIHIMRTSTRVATSCIKLDASDYKKIMEIMETNTSGKMIHYDTEESIIKIGGSNARRI